MEHLENWVKDVASRAASHGRSNLRMGLVTSYDPNGYRVKVSIMPDEVETGWMPLGTHGVGNGFGFMIGAAVGDHVIVGYHDGHTGAPFVLGRVFDNNSIPPKDPGTEQGPPTKEGWIWHESGSRLRFLTSGDVELVTNRDFIHNVGRDYLLTVERDFTQTVGRNVNLNGEGQLNLTVSGAVSITSSGGTIGVQAHGNSSWASVSGNIQVTSNLNQVHPTWIVD